LTREEHIFYFWENGNLSTKENQWKTVSHKNTIKQQQQKERKLFSISKISQIIGM